MSIHHYFPRLRWKAAEWEALQELPTNVLEGLTPIFNVLDIDWDFANNVYKKSLQDYLNSFGTTLAASWPLNRPVIVDVGQLDSHGGPTSHPLDICVQDAIQHGKQIIPVYSPHYSYNYLAAVQRNSALGIALKLKANLLLQGHYHLPNLIAAIGVPEQHIDLIIDFEDITSCTNELITNAHLLCQQMSNQAGWRNIILSSTCYPTSQAGINQHVIHTHRREEWELWKQVVFRGGLQKTPAFSDYPTSAAEITRVDPRFMQQYVSIRYSNSIDWIFVKGTAARGNGWGQTQQLCDTLVNSGLFYGSQFSWGDQYIHDRAQGTVGSGGSIVWRKVAHTHHLTLVAGDLINFSASHPAI
ncbi:beta family protein [Vibrio coralliilyticus]|uniref:beta family protein n=1 Tax=Vibrio coralliilyticus TaxID=190893 RepID=UPI00240984C4|nr:hypothetical protein [Vibrio coralliilyticus]WFB47846.1 hypothetical protein P6988_01085 [Vibrio coralliilyticus]